MSTNKLSHLKEGEKIYTPLERILHLRDDTDGLCFHDVNGCTYWVTDDDTFYTLDELKKLANDNMPKQGEMIEIMMSGKWIPVQFICFYEGAIVYATGQGVWLRREQWRPLQKKTELTLAEVEERLGIEKGSLIIK